MSWKAWPRVVSLPRAHSLWYRNSGEVTYLYGDVPLITAEAIDVWSTPRRMALIARGLPLETQAVSEEIKGLLRVTKECLERGIEQAVAGNRIGDIGYAVQNHAESNGFGVVRELVGHGLGKNLHEAPEVPNYGRRGVGVKLKEGMVLAIEPMINMGKRNVKQDEDGWTIVTADGLPSAHFEQDVAVRNGKAEVLSTHKYIEEVLENKKING